MEEQVLAHPIGSNYYCVAMDRVYTDAFWSFLKSPPHKAHDGATDPFAAVSLREHAFPGGLSPVPAVLSAEGPSSHSAEDYRVNTGHLETLSYSENPRSPGLPAPPLGQINYVK